MSDQEWRKACIEMPLDDMHKLLGLPEGAVLTSVNTDFWEHRTCTMVVRVPTDEHYDLDYLRRCITIAGIKAQRPYP